MGTCASETSMTWSMETTDERRATKEWMREEREFHVGLRDSVDLWRRSRWEMLDRYEERLAVGVTEPEEVRPAEPSDDEELCEVVLPEFLLSREREEWEVIRSRSH